MKSNKRRFGIKHPFVVFPNAGVFAKTLSDDAAAKADALAAKAFAPLADLSFLMAGVTTAADATAVSFKGFTLFYEIA